MNFSNQIFAPQKNVAKFFYHIFKNKQTDNYPAG